MGSPPSDIQGSATPTALARQIVALSRDPTPEDFPPAAANEALELTQRRRAERPFQQARSERTWWRLTGPERAQIRAAVMANNPWYHDHPESALLDLECVEELSRIVEGARHRPVTSARRQDASRKQSSAKRSERRLASQGKTGSR